MIRFNTQIRNLSPVGVDVFPKTRKKSKRTKQGACVCVLGVGGGTSTLNAKETKGIHSYLMILTFFANLRAKVISDIREVQICSIGNQQQFLWECHQKSKSATSLTRSTVVQAEIK